MATVSNYTRQPISVEAGGKTYTFPPAGREAGTESRTQVDADAAKALRAHPVVASMCERRHLAVA